MLWYKTSGKDSDVAVSTRIRLARNLEKIPFPGAMGNDERKKTGKDIADAVAGGNSALAKDFEIIGLDSATDVEKQLLSEQHLISPQMLDGGGHYVLLTKDRRISLMLMEEDHIRLQVIVPGLDLENAWELADKADSVIDESVTYAFDENLGYLTSCPTNVGTGLRASVMLHLPALAATGQLPKLIDSVNKIGIAVRGLYGEGSEAHGNLFQFSNQITLGSSEAEIIQKLKNIVLQMIERERKMREYLKENQYEAISDKVWRSLGTLKYARKIASGEAKMLISDVKLGQDLGIIPEKELNFIELSVITEPAAVMQNAGKKLTADERDKYRADIIREKLKNI